jgi:hypothetical protein
LRHHRSKICRIRAAGDELLPRVNARVPVVANALVLTILMPHAHLRWRILLLVLAVACGFVLREVGRLATASGWASRGHVATAVAAALAGVALIACALGPAAWWQRSGNACHRLGRRFAAAPLVDDSKSGWLLIGLALSAFAALLVRYYPLQQAPWDDDQGAFLLTARDIHDAGGIGWLLPALFRGEFAEANRHPLYLALLSFRPTFEAGKMLSAAIGIVTLALTTAMTARRIGWLGAGLFCVLLATNYEFCFHATRVVCEIVIVLLSGVLWLWHVPVRQGTANVVGSLRDDDPTVESLTNSTQSDVGPSRQELSTGHGVPGLLWSMLAGALLGLLYLTKGTGLLLWAGYVVWLMLAWLRRVRDRTDARNRTLPTRQLVLRLGVVTAAFLLVSSPLLVRNLRRFDSPFYNINSLLLFADQYDDINRFLADGTTTREAARQFLAHHSAGDIVRREASGLVWETFIILRSLGPTPLDDSRVLFGLPLAGIALLTMLSRRSAADGLLVVWGVFLWTMFAWYVPIAASERFILPLLVPLLYRAAEGVVHAIAALRPSAAQLLPWAAAAWVAVWVVATYASEDLAARLGR